MRKLVMVSLVILLSGGALFAQDFGSEEGNFDARDMLIEITGTPFDASSLLSFGTFRVRYAITDVVIPRFGVRFDLYNSQTTPDVVLNATSYQANVGIEYHLRIEGGFRSFFFIEGLVGQRKSSLESTVSPSVIGATSQPSSNSSSVSNRGYVRYGGTLGFGADYHLTSRFYFGSEIGYTFSTAKNSEVIVDNDLMIPITRTNIGGLSLDNVFRIGFKLL